MSKNDEKIKNMLSIIKQKNENLGPKPKVSWLTNALYRYHSHNKENNTLNLNTVNNIDTLILATMDLLSYQTSYEEAIGVLNIQKTDDLSYDGYRVSDWIEDFKLAASIIQYREKSAELLKIEKQLKALISEDAKTEMALDEIAKLLA